MGVSVWQRSFGWTLAPLIRKMINLLEYRYRYNFNVKSSVAEPKLFYFGSSSGSTFSVIFAPAPTPALYCHLKIKKCTTKINIIKNISRSGGTGKKLVFCSSWASVAEPVRF